MAILPVLDLMNGQVVRGIAGRRDQYRPVVSMLVDSASPLAIAHAFREHFGFTEFYLADLNAIQNGRTQHDVYEMLARDGFYLWIDAGIREADDPIMEKVANVDAAIVVGLESVNGPRELRRILDRAGPERVVFSLDMKSTRPLGPLEDWSTNDTWTIAQHAITLGVRRMIVLDLATVGVNAGVATEWLCSRLRRTYPDVELTTGGGVRGMDDVKRLHALGVDYVLVASALHDARITPDDL